MFTYMYKVESIFNVALFQIATGSADENSA